MAYVEVWKSGRLLTRRRVDEEKARKGCRVRLGSAGEVRVAVGQTETLGTFEVRMFEGDPPAEAHHIGETASGPACDESRLPPLSVGTPDRYVDPINGCPDIKGYKIIELLGRGGMGTVWRAEQLSTRRQVALKLAASRRIESPKTQALFQREVELTARLDHPNIARIYDSGLHQGTYYYAMELVDGTPLDQYVRAKALSRNQILALMQTVCQAVLFAHLRAVIHRDLKPSNILVGPDGQPHVLDFGLAKGLLEDEDALAISVEGQIAGTPSYMSPEQAAGHHGQLDTRTDVFSLGVILYELLIGQSPHDLSGSMFDVLHQITEGKIRRPREVDKSIDGELEAVLLTALAQDPDDRYPSAGALAKDISNYLDGEPLDARVHTIPYFLYKKALKYRVPAAIGLAVCLILLGTILVAYTKVVSERAISDSKDWQITIKSAQLTWRELELKALSKNEKEAHAALRIIRDEYIAAQDEISQLNHKLGERELPVVVRRVDLRPGEALLSTALVRKPSLPGAVQSWTLETLGHHGSVMRLAYSPDGGQLTSTGSDGTIRTWDTESGKLSKIFVHPNGTVDLPWPPKDGETGGLSWSADETAPAAGEIITRWKVDFPNAWQPLLQTASAIAFSPDRAVLACGDRDGTIRVVDLQSGQLRHAMTATWCGPVHSVRFSSDGKVLATGAGTGTICFWDARRWQPLGRFEAYAIVDSLLPFAGAIAWGPGDTLIARANNRQDALDIVDSQSGQVLRILSGHTQTIAPISWSPDGTLIAAGTVDGKVYMWDVKSDSSEPLVTFDAHAGSVNALVWQPNGSLITAGEDGKIEIWEPRSGTRVKIIEGYPVPIACLEFSPNSKTLAVGSENGIIRLWDTGGNWTSTLLRSEPNDIEARESKFTAVAWSPDGVLLASGDAMGRIRIWNPKSRRSTRSFAAGCGWINSLAWSGDGRILICGGADGTARAWDVKNDFQEHVVLLPLWGFAGPGIAINRAGDYRGPPGITEHLLYIVSTERGQETLTPADFKSRFGWVNEPWQVGLFAPGVEQVKRIFVKADTQPPYNGNSWDTAFNDLQDALKLAQPNTEIWVAAGIYRPDRGTGAHEASFHLKNGVRLLGGFAGTETSSHQRDPNENETVLSGDLKGDDGPGFANIDENSYHVVQSIGTEPSAILDGFVITGGNANGPDPKRPENAHVCGGGIYTSNASPTIINCLFEHNRAISEGGGMFTVGGSPTLTGCKFVSNSVGSTEESGTGGGMQCRGDCILDNCTFNGNSSTRWGGAIATHNCKPIITRCTFVKNSAEDSGGGIMNSADKSILTSCTFIGNSAENDGGGMSNYGESTPTLTDCKFISNFSRNGGGGMSNGHQSSPTLTNCVFIANHAEGYGGGIAVYSGCESALANCIFMGNVAHFGGGMSSSGLGGEGNPIRSNYSILVNCTFNGNFARVLGGGILNAEGSKSKMGNCILWGNRDSSGIGESAQFDNTRSDLVSAVDNCCIQGWTGNLGGTGNFGRDPLFVDPNGPDGKIGTLDDNLRLAPASPCRDAGDNSTLPLDTADLDKDGDVRETIPFDIEGKPRILNGAVDLGAYESG